jgi:hypothetical protein
VLVALDVDPLEARVRQVFSFDTPDLNLYEHGVVARARRTQTKPDDSVIKVRPIVPNEIPQELRAAEEFGVEVDAMPGGFVCSASCKRQLTAGKVKDSVRGRRALRKLFSKDQRAFLRSHAPDGIAGRSLDTWPHKRAQTEVCTRGQREKACSGAVELP